jgi:hypothetical protein
MITRDTCTGGCRRDAHACNVAGISWAVVPGSWFHGRCRFICAPCSSRPQRRPQLLEAIAAGPAAQLELFA